MTVPAGVTLNFQGNNYLEGQEVPKEAEADLTAALQAQQVQPVKTKAQPTPAPTTDTPAGN